MNLGPFLPIDSPPPLQPLPKVASLKENTKTRMTLDDRILTYLILTGAVSDFFVLSGKPNRSIKKGISRDY